MVGLETIWKKEMWDKFHALYTSFFDALLDVFGGSLVDGENGRFFPYNENDETVYNVTQVYDIACVLTDFMQQNKFGGFGVMALKVQKEYATEHNIDQKQLDEWDIAFGIQSCNR